mmetsp:Transcript_47665/g.132653  ORF Transcript_47665/g.132653 Transcript_47665/m.132653 type:complete len:218 (-) Transcript_47665:551-1204(-)
MYKHSGPRLLSHRLGRVPIEHQTTALAEHCVAPAFDNLGLVAKTAPAGTLCAQNLGDPVRQFRWLHKAGSNIAEAEQVEWAKYPGEFLGCEGPHIAHPELVADAVQAQPSHIKVGAVVELPTLFAPAPTAGCHLRVVTQELRTAWAEHLVQAPAMHRGAHQVCTQAAWAENMRLHVFHGVTDPRRQGLLAVRRQERTPARPSAHGGRLGPRLHSPPH